MLSQFAGEIQRRSQAPVVFGGLVRPDQSFITISVLRGTATNSLANLQVRSGEGLGGKVLALRRPASVRSYPGAQGITRAYDHAVSPEGLEAIMCLPVALPGQEPLAAVYLADRVQRTFSDQTTESLRPLLAGVAQKLHIVHETNRRLHALKADLERAARAELPDLRGDVIALIGSTTDARTRVGLQALLTRMTEVTPEVRAPRELSPLTRRETQVLVLAESGSTNLEIAVALGLTDGTVKSYMKTAMAKLGADNRVRACRAARERGFLH